VACSSIEFVLLSHAKGFCHRTHRTSNHDICGEQMFVAIVGTRFSGKTSIENYLVFVKGFTSVRLLRLDENRAVDGLNGNGVSNLSPLYLVFTDVRFRLCNQKPQHWYFRRTQNMHPFCLFPRYLPLYYPRIASNTPKQSISTALRNCSTTSQKIGEEIS